MSYLAKSTVAALFLLAGVASAHAQSSSVATLPPPGAMNAPAQSTAVPPSPKYVGPAPGAGEMSSNTAFQKPADWETNPSYRPYGPGMGPKPN